MSKSAVDFIGSMAGDFTQSLALERNLGAVSNRQWVVVVQSLPGTFNRGGGLGTFTVEPGYTMSDMRQVTISNASPSAFWRRQAFYMRSFRQLCQAIALGGDQLQFGQNATRNIPVTKTGSPILRLFFRVRGVCELVGWGTEGDVIIDPTVPITTSMGNIYSLSSSVFRLTNQNYTLRFKGYLGGQDQVLTTTEGLILNRTAEPSELDNAGTYYIDRIVCVSAVMGSAGSFSATLGFKRSFLFETGNTYVNPGDPPDGDYPGSLFSGIPGGGGSILQGGSYTLTWGNPQATNPPSLNSNLTHGSTLMPANGFNTSDPSAPGGVRRVPVDLTNALEVVFMGARAENELRPEETIDVRTPELLNEF